MNKVIEDQLKKVKVANIPKYDETTTHLIIPKKEGSYEVDFQIGHNYIIQLEDYLIKPFEGFNLHDNWNKGKPPIHTFLKCQVIEIMGKMIKINSIGYDMKTHKDIPDIWEGWLPRKGIKIVEVL